VNVHSKSQPRSLSDSFNHASDPHATKWLGSLIHEDIRAAIPVALLLAL
jgi:hypothetical protein